MPTPPPRYLTRSRPRHLARHNHGTCQHHARRQHPPDTCRGQQRGSAMGTYYRHTTPEMAARIATAIEQRLRVVLEVAEQVLEAQPHRSTQGVF